MFSIHSISDGHVPPLEYLPMGSITPQIGTALTLSGGNLAVASGTTKPMFIVMSNNEADNTSYVNMVPVIRITPDIIFDAIASVAMTGVNAGDSVTLNSYGTGITATKTGGVAEVVRIDGTAVYSHVLVRFN